MPNPSFINWLINCARWNLCFDNRAHEPDYENGQGRVVAFDDIPELAIVRRNIRELLGIETTLVAEGNYYFVPTCDIGYHGDSERRIVVALRLGDLVPHLL